MLLEDKNASTIAITTVIIRTPSISGEFIMGDGGNGGAGGGEGPLHFSKKDSSTAIYAVQVYSRAGHHRSSARFDCQLSGKAREDSDHTVLYWHLPSWRNCEHCNNFFGFHSPSPLLASTAYGGPGVSSAFY